MVELKLTPQEIRKVSLWIDLLVPQIGDYREANNWSDKDREFYDRNDKKRKLLVLGRPGEYPSIHSISSN